MCQSLQGHTNPLEVSLDHLLITPPSHFRLQKVGGFVVGFPWLQAELQAAKKYSFAPSQSRGNCLTKLIYFSGQNRGFRFVLFYSEGKGKNTTSGRNPRLHRQRL
jgi:hypothetical protein